MALKEFRPLTPTLRFKSLPAFDEITKWRPERSLLEPKKKSGGRNNRGRLTSRHIGGGHKQKYRKFDCKRRKRGVSAEVVGIEYDPNRSARVALSAGQQATLTNIEAGYALVKMPSGEIRRIHENCFATIGQVGNVDHMNVASGKAGRTRWQGRRPHVRGVAMNPVDHPMGGGQGKAKGGGGRHHPVSPWGQLAKGFKTRSKHKPSDRFILERRRKKKKA